MPRTTRPSPKELVEDWPNTVSDELVGEIARRFAKNASDAIGNKSLRSVATEAEIDYATLWRVLHGEQWPDLIVIAKLERALAVDLWPGRIDGD